jgi:hypothetical protein
VCPPLSPGGAGSPKRAPPYHPLIPVHHEFPADILSDYDNMGMPKRASEILREFLMSEKENKKDQIWMISLFFRKIAW